MSSPRVLILRAPGTNCDEETALAFQQAGAVAQRVHVNRLLEDPRMIDSFQILCIPGGFSYGDDVAAGKILAIQIEHHLAEACQRFRDENKLVLGICNGFQVLLKAGLLLGGNEGAAPRATLTWNDCGVFQNLWVDLAVHGDRCVFLRDVQRMSLPIAHAEGKFVARDEATLAQLDSNGQLVLRYAAPRGAAAPTNDQVLPFPTNPNGSQANVAGVCDPTGRVLGLMPHPERYVHPTHHPRWTRSIGQPDGEADGNAIFRNAVRFFA